MYDNSVRIFVAKLMNIANLNPLILNPILYISLACGESRENRSKIARRTLHVTLRQATIVQPKLDISIAFGLLIGCVSFYILSCSKNLLGRPEKRVP